MKKIIPLLITVFLVVFQNCNQTQIQYGDKPQRWDVKNLRYFFQKYVLKDLI